MSKQSTRRRKARMIRAASQAAETIPFECPVTIAAAAGEDQKGPARLHMMAYAGGALELSAYPVPLVVDLAGMTPRTEQLPVYWGHDVGHDGTKLVGHTDQHDMSGGQLVVNGALSGATNYTTQILDSHKAGFKWQASIGASPTRADLEHVPAGRRVEVNGQQFVGPIIVARKSILRHIAILPEGADKQTHVSIAAGAADADKEHDMKFDEWAKTLFGGESPELTDKQTATLQARYEKEKDAGPPIEAGSNGKAAAGPDAPKFDVDAIVKTHKKHVATIEAKAGEYEGKIEAAVLAPILTTAKTKAAELKLQALNEQKPDAWLEVALIRAESDAMLEMIRAERPTGPAIHGSSRDVKPEVIEAALCLSSDIQKPEDHFKEEVLEAASTQYRNMGLQQFLIQAAASNGYISRPGERIHSGNLRGILQHAFTPQIQANAFSGIDVSGILSNTANKILLSGFNQVPQTWREVATIETATDFKEMTRYRMTADLEYEEVPAGGEIQHGTLGEESYTLQIQTYAKMLALTRTDIINDDLGAFNALRTRLGIGAVLKMNKLFWKLWMNNASFFTPARGNYQEGAATALGTAGLNTAIKLFRDARGPDGNLTGFAPDRMIVPTALEATALELFVSGELRDTTADTRTFTANIHRGKYRPVPIPELGDSSFTGNSDLAWYLLADPAILATAAMGFLNGQQSPTIESADADFKTLGVQLRGYHDFGVNFSEFRAGVKSKGEA